MLWNLFYLLEIVLNLTPKIWFCRANCKQSQQNVQKNNLFWFRRKYHVAPNTQTHKHTMYFNLATQGANLRGKHSHKNKNKFQPPTINQNRPPKYRANLHHSQAQNLWNKLRHLKSKTRKNNLILFKFTWQNHANLKQNTQEYFD